ncbi:MAG: hypothetical protein EXR11_05255 [Rhodospirillaceae bacterium]|nr:hypothetical protein [Rhodospirillaceae bacterium]
MNSMLPATLAQVATSDPVKISGFGVSQRVPEDLSACFAEFLRRIVPTSPAYMAARNAGVEIAGVLRDELYRNATIEVAETDHIVVGSVGKRTAIAPIRVVDLLYALPPKLGLIKAADALKMTWAVVKSRHPETQIAEDQSGVIVPRAGITVKILPCLPREGAFLVPGPPTLDRASGWSITNPIAEAATLRLMDSMYGSRPRLLLAVLKAWRNTNEVPISSFALELLAQDFYTSAPRPYALAPALVDFWAWSRKRTPATLRPPGASTHVVIDDAWHGKAKAAYWRATLGEYHVGQGKVVDAALEWRLTFGPKFPVPGDRAETLPLFREKARRHA